MTVVHVYPVDDQVRHTTDNDQCVCGPITEPVPRDDGSMGWLLTHHSLDGREHREGRGRARRSVDLRVTESGRIEGDS